MSRLLPWLLIALILAAPAATAAGGVTLPAGTPLTLSAAKNVDSGSSKVGDPVAFMVRKAVVVKGVTLVAASAPGRGSVVYCRPARVGGRGELMVQVQAVQAVDGSWVPVGVRKGDATGLAGVIPEGLMDLTEPVFPKGREGLLSAQRVLDAWTLEGREFVRSGGKLVAAAPTAPAGLKGTRVRVPAGTALRVRPKAELSSGGVKTGDRVDFVCVETVLVEGRPVIQAGAAARGTVLRAVDAEETRQPGELVVSVDTVAGVDGRALPVASFEGDKGGKNRALKFGASRLIPLAGLAIRGRQAVIAADQVQDVGTSADRLVVVPPGATPAAPLPAPSPSE